MIPQRKTAQFDLPSGTMLGKYETIRKIAMGGMAEIYLARARGTAGFEKLCVIKRILPTMTEDPHFVQMFLDEARLAATLQHPNIADVYEVGDDDGAPFFAMEFIHGQDVRAIRHAARQRKEVVPLSIALAIIHATASALDYAHDRTGPDGKNLGLVHRDVSSSNILVGYEGAIKLIDFGIARATSRTHQTRTGTLKGKIPYMSPEQCRGFPLDRRSDLFSLGVVLYELTTGRRPFRGDTDFMIMDQIVNQGAQPPSTLMRDYPPELDEIVMRMLAHKAEDRYQTGEQLLQDLDPFIGQHRLWVSAKPLSRYMRAAFPDTVAAWDSASAEGVTMAQFVSSRFTGDSQRSDIATPPSAFPGLLPLSQEMPAVQVTGELAAAIRPTPQPFVAAAPSAITDVPSKPTAYPSIKRSRTWMVVAAGILALSFGGLAAVVLAGGHDEAAPTPTSTERSGTTPAKSTPAGSTDETTHAAGARTTEVKPTETETRSAETRAAETRPAETRPAETKPAEAKATEAKAAEAKAAEVKAATKATTKATVTKTTVTKATVTKTKTATTKKPDPATDPAKQVKPADTKTTETKEPGWDQDSVFLPPSK